MPDIWSFPRSFGFLQRLLGGLQNCIGNNQIVEYRYRIAYVLVEGVRI
jgi:hypothetical protein